MIAEDSVRDFLFEFDVCNHRGQRAWLQLWTVNSLPMTLFDQKLIDTKAYFHQHEDSDTREEKDMDAGVDKRPHPGKQSKASQGKGRIDPDFSKLSLA